MAKVSAEVLTKLAVFTFFASCFPWKSIWINVEYILLTILFIVIAVVITGYAERHKRNYHAEKNRS